MTGRGSPWGFGAVQDLPPVQGDGVILVSGEELVMKPVNWLWPSWLAAGKVHLLAGEPGQGKTTLAAAIAATVTAGARFPDGAMCEKGSVLVWSGEDDPADTLKPRLLAAGADMSRLHFVTGAVVRGRTSAFNPARDMAALLAEANAIGDVRLLILDPIVSAITGDSHKNTEVRKDMQPLVEWAGASGAAILGITHLSKGGKGQDPTQRVSGSVAFAAVVRAVMIAAKVPTQDGSDRRILARTKSNLGPDGDGIEYQIEQTEVAPGICASRIAWGGLVQGSARQLLSAPDAVQPSALDAAQEFLKMLLGSGDVLSRAVWEAGEAAGHSEKTLRRAAKSLNVVPRKTREGWCMKLPSIGGKMVNVPNVAASGSGASWSSWPSLPGETEGRGPREEVAHVDSTENAEHQTPSAAVVGVAEDLLDAASGADDAPRAYEGRDADGWPPPDPDPFQEDAGPLQSSDGGQLLDEIPW